jgi:integration host factor subunit beta
LKWTELIGAMSERTGLPAKTIRQVMDAFVEITLESVTNGEDVRVRRIGTISRRWRNPSVRRSISDQRKMMLDGRWVPRFRPATELRDTLAGLTDQSWKDPRHQAAWNLAEALVGDLLLYHAELAPSCKQSVAPDSLERRCAEAFGPYWDRVVQTFRRDVPEDVRQGRNYLGVVARRHLAPTE